MTGLYSPPRAEHLVMVGPDWWSCLCWQGAAYLSATEARDGGAKHAGTYDAETVTTDWGWADVSAVGTPEEAHQWLWEQKAI